MCLVKISVSRLFGPKILVIKYFPVFLINATQCHQDNTDLDHGCKCQLLSSLFVSEILAKYLTCKMHKCHLLISKHVTSTTIHKGSDNTSKKNANWFKFYELSFPWKQKNRTCFSSLPMDTMHFYNDTSNIAINPFENNFFIITPFLWDGNAICHIFFHR